MDQIFHGTPRNDVDWQAAIVVHGPHHGDVTRDIIRTFLGNNDKILVIVSTYLPEEDSDNPIGKLLTPFEKFMVLEGVLVYTFVKRSPESNVEFWRLAISAGLRYACQLGIQYSLTIRSDMITQCGKDEVKFLIKELDDILPKVESGTTQQIEAVTDHGLFGHTAELMRHFERILKSKPV